jgi:rhomboid family protein
MCGRHWLPPAFGLATVLAHIAVMLKRVRGLLAGPATADFAGPRFPARAPMPPTGTIRRYREHARAAPMIPLRDSAAPRRLMPINTTLIAANVLAFAYEMRLGPATSPFVERWAMVPDRVAAAVSALAAASHGPGLIWPLATIFTAMFLHGGIWHLAGNMLYLFIFGAAVEGRLGPGRYLGFYFVSGLAAAVATVLMAPASRVPVIGASGAIAGVLGAYFVMYPRGKILTILPLFVYSWLIEIPAVILLLLWFAVQLWAGLEEGGPAAIAGGVAWWAHVGGFLFGVALGPLLARPEKRRRRKRT